MNLGNLHIKLMETMSEAEKQDFEAGLRKLNMANPSDRIALREAIKRLRPEYTDEQLDIFINPKASPEKTDWII